MRLILFSVFLLISSLLDAQAQILKHWHQHSINKRLDKIEKSLLNTPIELGANLLEIDGQIFLATNNVKWLRKTMRPRKSGFRVMVLSLVNDPCVDAEQNSSVFAQVVQDNVMYRNARKSKNTNLNESSGVYYLCNIPESHKGLKNNFQLQFTVDGEGRAYHNYVHAWGYTPVFDSIYQPDKTERIQAFLNSFKNKPNSRIDTLLAEIPFQASSDTLHWRDISSEVVFKMGTATSIDSVVINSYASIDGDREDNLFLAQKRGENILRFLKEFKLDSTNVQITCGENWPLFKRQYKKAGMRFFEGKTHQQVKSFFADSINRKYWRQQLEEQRAAQIELYCTTLHPIMKAENDELEKMYNQAIYDKSYSEAEMVLHEMWTRELAGKYTVPALDSLVTNNSRKANDIREKYIWLSHLNNRQTKECNIAELEDLLKIQPRDPEVNYWYQYKMLEIGTPFLDRDTQKKFEQSIKGLRRCKVPKVFINHLLMMFYVKAASYAQESGSYGLKSYYMKSIYSLAHRSFNKIDELTDVASFCSKMYYPQLGRKLLQPYVLKGKYNKDMLEAFIWMTLYKSDYYADSNYQLLVKIMAENNPVEYVKMIQSAQNGGIAFFLLNHPFYRALYCNCITNVTMYYGEIQIIFFIKSPVS